MKVTFAKSEGREYRWQKSELKKMNRLTVLFVVSRDSASVLESRPSFARENAMRSPASRERRSPKPPESASTSNSVVFRLESGSKWGNHSERFDSLSVLQGKYNFHKNFRKILTYRVQIAIIGATKAGSALHSAQIPKEKEPYRLLPLRRPSGGEQILQQTEKWRLSWQKN